MKENCETDWRFSFKREKHFRRRPFPEQNIDKLFFRRGDFVRRALIRRQIANQFQDDWHIFHARRTNLEISKLLHLSDPILTTNGH